MALVLQCVQVPQLLLLVLVLLWAAVLLAVLLLLQQVVLVLVRPALGVVLVPQLLLLVVHDEVMPLQLESPHAVQRPSLHQGCVHAAVVAAAEGMGELAMFAAGLPALLSSAVSRPSALLLMVQLLLVIHEAGLASVPGAEAVFVAPVRAAWPLQV